MIKKIANIFFSAIYVVWIILSLVFFFQMLMSFPANGSNAFKGGLLMWVLSLGLLGGIILLINYLLQQRNLKKIFSISFIVVLFLLLTLFLR